MMDKDYQALYEACKQQAQIWKQEARGANDTIAKIYQLCTGGKGEPGNWNAEVPVLKLIAEREMLRRVVEAYEDWEAQIILENKCWTGQNVRLTDDLYDRMMEIQAMRNVALGRFQ
jgi:hypothetical protein